MTTLPQIARELLDDLQTDQTGLAELAGISRSAVSQWMSGQSKSIGPGPAFALQRRTGWSAEYLQLGTGPKKLSDVRKEEAERLVAEWLRRGDMIDLRGLPEDKRETIRRVVAAMIG